MPDINWYPGHMAKSKRLLIAQLRVVDAVIELCDARAPRATRNPELLSLCRGKAHVLVLNKADLASESETQRFLALLRAKGVTTLAMSSTGGKTREVLRAISEATRPGIEKMAARGVNKTARLMVVGIPNVGKSTFINRLYGRGITKTEDRPGVTRSNQWVKVSSYLELLDTPGLLWPKLADQGDARTLAFLGSIRDQIMDGEALAGQLLQKLLAVAPSEVRARFKLSETPGNTPEALLEAACFGRGWLMAGGRPDTERAAALVLDEFRAGKIGRITLERA